MNEKEWIAGTSAVYHTVRDADGELICFICMSDKSYAIAQSIASDHNAMARNAIQVNVK